MRLSIHSRLTIILSAILFCICCSTTTGDISGGPKEIGISTWENDQIRPRVAFNNTLDEFLVVWEDHHWGWGEDWDIYGRRINSNGDPIGGQFAIAWQNVNHCLNPDVIYNPQADEYLVVWEYEYSESDHDIYAQRIAGDGTLVGEQIAIATLNNWESRPAAAYNAWTNEYMVAWESRQGNGEFVHNDIQAVRLNFQGIVAGEVITVAADLIDESAPAVSAFWEYLVVWQGKKDSTGDYGVYGRMISEDGGFSGGVLDISTWEYDQLVPRIAFNEVDYEYMVVWEDHHWGWGDDWDIYGRRIGADGSFPGGAFGIFWENPNHCLHPDIAWQMSTGNYLVTWEYEYSPTDHDVYYRQVRSDETLMGDAEAISSTGSQEQHPAVQAGNGLDRLIVWQDGRNIATGGLDIYGNYSSLPAFEGSVFEGQPDDQSGSFVGVSISLYCSNDSGYLGTLADTVVTNAQGTFVIPVEGMCEYFHIVAEPPAGFISTAAMTIGGVTAANNQISFTYPLEGKVLGGNNFWMDRADLSITVPVQIQEIPEDSALVFWETNVESDSVVVFGSAITSETAVHDPGLNFFHAVILTGLEPSTTYRLTAQSTDEFGETVSSRALTFETMPLADNTNPTVTAIDLNKLYTGAVISANAADDTDVEKVEFLIDDSLVFTDFSEPYEFIIDPSTFSSGTHKLTSRVIDLSGNTAQEDKTVEIPTTIDTSAPMVTITSHANNETVAGKVIIGASISDNLGVREALLSVDAWSTDIEKWPVPYPQNQFASLIWDTTKIANGSHRIAVTVYDGDWKSGVDTVDLIVYNPPPPPPPKLVVLAHTAQRNQNTFVISITVKNIGQSEAKDVVILDNLILFQPIEADNAIASYLPEIIDSSKTSDCLIKSKVPIKPGETYTYAFYAVPILTYPVLPVPMIGNSVELTWASADGTKYNAAEQPVVTKTTAGQTVMDAYNSAVKSCDYLIVTDPENLLEFNPVGDVDALLSSMAELARLKSGVIGYLHGPFSIYREFMGDDGFASGDVLGDKNDEIIIADASEKAIFYYPPGNRDWFSFPGLQFKCGFNNEGFQSGDAIAVGLLPGGTKEKVVMADHSANRIVVYESDGTVKTSFPVDFEAHDGLAVGDVHSNVRDEIIIADRSANSIYTYTMWGSKLVTGIQSFQAHDGFVTGDVLGDDRDEIIVANRNANKISIISPAGIVLGSFSCDFEAGDGLAAGYMYQSWPDDKEEIVVTDHSDDTITIYRGDGKVLKVIKRQLDPSDRVATGNLFSGLSTYTLIADWSESSIDGHLPSQNTGNKHILHDLIRADDKSGLFDFHPKLVGAGQWSINMKDDWVSNGYMLIVGETQIIPAWGDKRLGSVLLTTGRQALQPQVTDYPYASTYGDQLKPELAIGRIIGNNAKELRIPIETSISVAKGTTGFGFDRSDALAVDGFPRTMRGGADNINFKNEALAAAYTLAKKNIPTSLKSTPDYTVYSSPGVVDFLASSKYIENMFFNSVKDRDIVFLTGHGNATSWDEIGAGELLGETSLFGNTNPFVFASSCSTASYHGTTSLAEGCLRSGAGVYVGATKWGLGSHMWISSYLYDNWGAGESVGDAVRRVKQNIGEFTYNSYFDNQTVVFPNNKERYWTAIYHVFGDPKFGDVGSPQGLNSSASPSSAPPEIEAPAHVDVAVSAYEIERIGDFDHVTIPGGMVLDVPDEPVVPYYRVFHHYPRGTEIQDVSMTERSEPIIEEGLQISIGVVAIGGDSVGSPVQSDQIQSEQWWPGEPFEWSVSEYPDRTTLAITIYPFNYNALTTESRFYEAFSFDINHALSNIEIVRIQTDKQEYIPEEAVNVELLIVNAGDEPVDIILAATIVDEATGERIDSLDLQTLKGVMGPVSYTATWNSADSSDGYYRFVLELLDTSGVLLDTKSLPFRMGVPLVEISQLMTDREYLTQGTDVEISLGISNTGSTPVSGAAIVNVMTSAGVIVNQFRHDFSDLWPGNSYTFLDIWDTSEATGAEYRIAGYVLYDGQSTNSTSIVISRCGGGIMVGDISQDCYVDMEDIALMALEWSRNPCLISRSCNQADFNNDGIVKIKDLRFIADHWLYCNDPENVECNQYWK